MWRDESTKSQSVYSYPGDHHDLPSPRLPGLSTGAAHTAGGGGWSDGSPLLSFNSPGTLSSGLLTVQAARGCHRRVCDRRRHAHLPACGRTTTSLGFISRQHSPPQPFRGVPRASSSPVSPVRLRATPESPPAPPYVSVKRAFGGALTLHFLLGPSPGDPHGEHSWGLGRRRPGSYTDDADRRRAL